MGSNPISHPNKKRQVSTETCRFLNDVFHCVERDVHFVRDVRLRRVMCLRAWVEHITSLLRSKNITASETSNITCPSGQTSLFIPQVQHHPPFCRKYLFRSPITKNRLAKSKSIFYPSRRLGISSRVSVYIINHGIAVVGSHHAIGVYIISCGLMIYSTPCWWYTRLRRESKWQSQKSR